VKQLAGGLHVLSGFPPNTYVYLLGDVLGTRAAATRRAGYCARCAGAGSPRALTHAPSRPPGIQRADLPRAGLPFWSGAGDVEAAETGDIVRFQPDVWINRLFHRLMSGPGHLVNRALREGDEVG
jgi:hypothetical protein